MGQKSKLFIDLRHCSFVRMVKLSERLIRAAVDDSVNFIMLLLAELTLAQFFGETERFEGNFPPLSG